MRFSRGNGAILLMGGEQETLQFCSQMDGVSYSAISCQDGPVSRLQMEEELNLAVPLNLSWDLNNFHDVSTCFFLPLFTAPTHNEIRSVNYL